MIRLTRKRRAADLPPDFRAERLTVKNLELLQLFYDAKTSGQPIAFSSAKWKSAKAKLRLDTAKKCAYCEAPTSVVAHGDVEHFRPKSAYWWLAYCFDNYLFSCQVCNQLFKGDAFPIHGSTLSPPPLPDTVPDVGQRPALVGLFVLDPATVTDDDCIARWSGERADLPHPYLEDPEVLFRYEVDAPSGEIWVRAADGERAQRALHAVEKVLGLNRDELRKLRYAEFATIAVLKLLLDDAGLSASSRTGILKEFARRQKNDFPFAGMHRYFARTWAIPAP